MNISEKPEENSTDLSLPNFLHIIHKEIGIPKVGVFTKLMIQNIVDISNMDLNQHEAKNNYKSSNKQELAEALFKLFSDDSSVNKIYNDPKRLPRRIALKMIPAIDTKAFCEFLSKSNNNSEIFEKNLNLQFKQWKETIKDSAYWKLSGKETDGFRICATLFAELIRARADGKTSISLKSPSSYDISNTNLRSSEKEIIASPLNEFFTGISDNARNKNDNEVSSNFTSISSDKTNSVDNNSCATSINPCTTKEPTEYITPIETSIPSAVSDSCLFCKHWECKSKIAAEHPDKYYGRCILKDEPKISTSTACEYFKWTGKFPGIWSSFNL